MTSPLTIRQYNSIYNVLTTKLFEKKDMEWIVKNPKLVIAKIEENYTNIKTRKNYITAIMSYIKSHDYKASYSVFYDKLIDYSTSIEKEYDSNKIPKRRMDAYLNWNDLINIRDKLAKDSYASKGHLLFSMYSYIEPVRQDYGNVRILKKGFRSEKNKTQNNYIVLTSRPYLILNNYKTSDTYGTVKITIPIALKKIIMKSLEKQPREYLFMNVDGKPYNDNSFTKFANRLLVDITGRPNYSLGLLRRARISAEHTAITTRGRKKELAKGMLHSPQTAEVYRVV